MAYIELPRWSVPYAMWCAWMAWGVFLLVVGGAGNSPIAHFNTALGVLWLLIGLGIGAHRVNSRLGLVGVRA